MVAGMSVQIDLERGSLLEQSFALPFRFRVPDLLYRNELKGRQLGPVFGKCLLRLGLEVVELSGDEVRNAVLLGKQNRGLSLPASFAFILAANRKWTLLTGDAVFRALSQYRKVSNHGVLWLLDHVHRSKLASPVELG